MAKNVIKFNNKKQKEEKVIYVQDRHEKINKRISKKISALLILTILCLALVLVMFTGWIAPKGQSFLNVDKNEMTIQALSKTDLEKAMNENRRFNSLFKTVFGNINDVKRYNGQEYVVYNEDEQSSELFNLTFEKLYTKKAMYKFNFKGWLITNKKVNLTIDYSNYYTIFTHSDNNNNFIKTSNDAMDLKKYFKENISETNLYDWYLVKDNTNGIEANKIEENKIDLSTEELIEQFDFKTNLYGVKK